jgi:GDPmannose 4,6-dehydratase
MVRDLPKQPRLFHASSSEIFGEPACVPQDDTTPSAPINPYGCAKAFATQMVTIYRRVFKLFACNGIMFNHESPRRGENFVTQKICRAAAAIKLGRQKELLLGDTSARRDWGHAKDYVRGMWLTLQHDTPDNFVFATGELHSVQEVVDIAFDTVGLDWSKHVRRDQRFMRPAEPQRLVGNPAKAKSVLGWEAKISFRDLVVEMTESELAHLSRPPSGG